MRKLFFPSIRLESQLKKSGYSVFETSQRHYIWGWILNALEIGENGEHGYFGRNHPLQWHPRIYTFSDEVAKIAEPYAVVIKKTAVIRK